MELMTPKTVEKLLQKEEPLHGSGPEKVLFYKLKPTLVLKSEMTLGASSALLAMTRKL
jgi:hypothetical protein